jgi:hypothetical protein
MAAGTDATDRTEPTLMPIPTPTLIGGSYATLSAMLTPALFMTATGSLIISTSNRMSRIVDRIRVLDDQADRLDCGQTDRDYPELRRAQADAELRDLVWRSDRVRIALTLLYLAQSAFVGTSLSLAIEVLLGSRLLSVPTLLAVVGVALLLVACVNLTREAHRALGSNRQELKFHRALRDRRHADRLTDQG